MSNHSINPQRGRWQLLMETAVDREEIVNTACGMCYNACAIRVRKVNGKAVAIEGQPDSPLGGRGGVCGKGAAGLMTLYDPNRLNVPLRRTNPEKGIGVDPKWQEITWDEALDEITERLRKIRADNPEKLWVHGTTTHSYGGTNTVFWRWQQAFGTHQSFRSGGSLHCGNAAHLNAGLIHGSWSVAPDWRYTSYVLKFGSSKGTGSGHSMTANARLRAEAIARGAREIVFDPMCNFAGGKASEWVPILPGTDTAVALAVANVIVNELKIWDEEFIKWKTNLPFLTSINEKFLRQDGECLIWDRADNRAKRFDDPTLKDPAIEGDYKVDGVAVRPAFVKLQEHLGQFSPEWASGVSSVPAGTIRRISREFVENARIGSTIEIEGKVFPYRPVAAVIFRGGEGHTNGVHACWAVDLLNQLVGAEDVPGGCLGWPAIKLGYQGNGHFDMIPRVGQDGVIVPSTFYGGHEPWPIPTPSLPCTTASCREFWTMTTISPLPNMRDCEELWGKLGMGVRPEMLMVYGANFIVGIANWEDQLELAKKIPFIVQFDLYSNETAEAVADILLPDLCYLERLEWHANLDSFFFNHPPTYEEWSYHPQIPVVDNPAGQRRYIIDILNELADRLGFRDKWNGFFNRYFKITDPELQLKPDEKLTWTEMGDRVLKWCFGPEHGIEFFKQNGYVKWPKHIEEVYWRWNWESLQGVRSPVYRDNLIEIGEKVRELGQARGLEMEYGQYVALPSYYPTQAIKEMTSDYDLLAFSYRDILHTNSQTAENPWLDEISQLCPYTYTITMNAETARKKGLKDGDLVFLETPRGRREKGILKVMEGQHPKTVAIAGQAGLWAKGRPLARGKGSNFDLLLESDLQHYDPISLNIETSVAVKIYKAKEVK